MSAFKRLPRVQVQYSDGVFSCFRVSASDFYSGARPNILGLRVDLPEGLQTYRMWAGLHPALLIAFSALVGMIDRTMKLTSIPRWASLWAIAGKHLLPE